MFEVIIKHTEKKIVKGGHKWLAIDQTPLTKEDVQESYFPSAELPKMKERYGYTPEYEKEEEEEKEIYRQKVETLNVADVIKAINSL